MIAKPARHYFEREDCRVDDDPDHPSAFKVWCGRCKRGVGNLTIEQARARRDQHNAERHPLE